MLVAASLVGFFALRAAVPKSAPDRATAVDAELAAAARLPAVHPLAALRVEALAPLGRVRLHESLLRREELVVRREHGAA